MDNKVEIRDIPVAMLKRNIGQIKGLPLNPRFITRTRHKQLQDSIENNGKMLNLRELLVFPFDNEYIVIAGNMRLEAVKKLNWKTAPCKILPADTSVEELKKIAILDNASYGEWDYDTLVNDYECDDVLEYGIKTEEKKQRKPSVRITFQSDEDRERFLHLHEDALIASFDCKVTKR